MQILQVLLSYYDLALEPKKRSQRVRIQLMQSFVCKILFSLVKEKQTDLQYVVIYFKKQPECQSASKNRQTNEGYVVSTAWIYVTLLLSYWNKVYFRWTPIIFGINFNRRWKSKEVLLLHCSGERLTSIFFSKSPLA